MSRYPDIYSPKGLGQLLKTAGKNWLEDKAPRLGAALAFYSIIAIGPLLIIVIAIAGLAFGHEAAAERIIASIGELVGETGVESVRVVVENSHRTDAGILATIVGIITLIIGTSGVFGELQDGLNTVWRVKPKPNQGFWRMVQNRFLSFTMVLGTGFLLLISLVVSTALAAMGEFMVGILPSFELVLNIANIVVSFAVITILFAMIFKFLPDARIKWSEVWIGAGFTALLFTLGKFGIGFYIGHSDVSTVYGAAGSLIILLLWVYFSAQIVYFGAEMTEVYANRYGSGVVPSSHAMKIATHEEVVARGKPRPAT